MTKQRRVTGHPHHVSIPFHSGHERGLGESALPVVLVFNADNLIALGCVFAEENLWSIAVILVEAIDAGEEPGRVCVTMFIHNVCLEFTQFGPEKIKSLILWRRTGSRH